VIPILEFALIALFAVVWPLYTWRIEYPRLLRDLERGDLGARLRAYRRTMAQQWTFAAAALVLWFLPGRPAAGIGLGLPHPLRAVIGLALAVALIVLLAAQRKTVGRRPELLERVRLQLGTATSLVPHTLEERRTWVALSTTAGVCEEILFRGFLVAWLTPLLGVPLAFGGSALLFAGAHTYLGRTGAIRAGIAGLVMGGLYALTGSLWVPMLLHAAVDIHSGSLGFEAMRARPAPAAA
jgi:membrane protease YdiL (CAAX protease family)